MIHEHDPDDEPEYIDADDDPDDFNPDDLDLDFPSETQIFLEMRQQNLELLKVAAQVSGYSGGHGPLKPNDLRSALKSIWEIYAEFYTWIDPEEAEDDEDLDDEE